MKRLIILLAIALLITLLAASCKKEETPEPFTHYCTFYNLSSDTVQVAVEYSKAFLLAPLQFKGIEDHITGQTVWHQKVTYHRIICGIQTKMYTDIVGYTNKIY